MIHAYRYRALGTSFDRDKVPVGEISGNLDEGQIRTWVANQIRLDRTYALESRDGRQEALDAIVSEAEAEAGTTAQIRRELGI